MSAGVSGESLLKPMHIQIIKCTKFTCPPPLKHLIGVLHTKVSHSQKLNKGLHLHLAQSCVSSLILCLNIRRNYTLSTQFFFTPTGQFSEYSQWMQSRQKWRERDQDKQLHTGYILFLNKAIAHVLAFSMQWYIVLFLLIAFTIKAIYFSQTFFY